MPVVAHGGTHPCNGRCISRAAGARCTAEPPQRVTPDLALQGSCCARLLRFSALGRVSSPLPQDAARMQDTADLVRHIESGDLDPAIDTVVEDWS